MGKLKNLLSSILLAGILLQFPAFALAHPGRLNDDGCHQVHKDWKYKNGKVLKAGSMHCHRGLGKMKLDGSELLEDPKDPGEEAEKKTPRERNNE
jgi:hypothetical protein